MANKKHTQVFQFQGGYATDLAPQVRTLDFLVKAENVIYEVTGAVRKVGGAARLNSTVITGTPSVTGMFDFWVAGAGGTFTQYFVAATSDSKVYNFGTGGTASNITGAATIEASAMPIFVQARDLLTIWWDSASTPLRWTGTGNVATLSSGAPSARSAAFHLNRIWAAGTNANPSRLFYSSSVSATDWTGTDTGSFDIDPEDGDRIIGLMSYKRKLFVFKGPNKGSIHVLSGTAPTGADAFSRTLLMRGLALQSHNSMVEVGDDVLFMSQYGIHSLVATDRFADFQESLATRFLMGYFRDSVNRNRLNKVWGVNYASKGMVIWTMTAIGGTANAQAFGLSYIRRSEEGIKPFVWNRTCQSVALRINPTTSNKELVFGSNNGFILREDVSDRNIETSTAYNMRIQTPQLILGMQDAVGSQRFDQPVTLHRLYLRTRPTGTHNITVALQRDDLVPESYTFSQGQAGFILGTSELGSGTLGGGNLQVGIADIVGECRSVSLDITQGGLNEDANIYEIALEFTPISEVGSSTM